MLRSWLAGCSLDNLPELLCIHQREVFWIPRFNAAAANALCRQSLKNIPQNPKSLTPWADWDQQKTPDMQCGSSDEGSSRDLWISGEHLALWPIFMLIAVTARITDLSIHRPEAKFPEKKQVHKTTVQQSRASLILAEGCRYCISSTSVP